MTTRTSDATAQLGFGDLLADADRANAARQMDKATAHLPAGYDEALPFYRALIERHHTAMLAADVDEALRLREEAHMLALKLNGGDSGILAHDNSPGYVLGRETAASPGTIPLWGQTGEFIVETTGMRVRIEIDGLFGIGSKYAFWPGFSAHAVDFERPFLSETGYRSFLGMHPEPKAGLTPDAFVRVIIASHVARELKGHLVLIGERYRVAQSAD